MRSFVALLVGLLLLPGIASARPPPSDSVPGSSPGVDLTLGADGTLAVVLSISVPNGSALRAAMDGNFTPIISALPINQSQRASILGQIQSAENAPIISSYFGNRDGTVSAGEVTLFQQLLAQESRLLPSGSLTGSGVVSLMLDGHGPTGARLGGAIFAGAEGVVTSGAPLGVVTSLAYQFNYGSGNQNLSFSISGTISPPAGIPGPTGVVEVRVTTPAQTTIGSTAGLANPTLQNDPWGLGNAQAGGSYTPSANSSITVAFHPSFPTGYVAIGAASAGIVAVAALLMLRRRRRIRSGEATKRPEASLPEEERVGPSGSA